MYNKYTNTEWETVPHLFDFFINSDGQSDLIDFLKTPLTYLYNKGLPYYISRKNLTWTKDEDDFIKRAYNETEINFSFLSLCMPSRTGKQISARFHELCLLEQIQIKDDDEKTKHLKEYNHSYFLPNVEQFLAKEFRKLHQKGVQINKNMVRETAKEIYCSANVLSERATFNHFVHNRLKIYTDDSNDEYTEEFKIISNQIKGDIDECNSEEERNEVVEVIRNDYNLPKPIFSHTWMKAFLFRNHLSWRMAVYARRGSIDPTYAKIYIAQVAHAVNTYGWDLTFNMDETCVRLNNSNKYTLAPTGLIVGRI